MVIVRWRRDIHGQEVRRGADLVKILGVILLMAFTQSLSFGGKIVLLDVLCKDNVRNHKIKLIIFSIKDSSDFLEKKYF